MTGLTAGRALPAPAQGPSPGLLPGLRAAALAGAERALAFGAASHARACLLLLVLGLVCFLPGLAGLQPMDRDEPRFAQASRQMLETGDLVDIRFQGEARHKKPVGIYWAQAASVAAAEHLGVADARARILFYRLPSLIGALAAILLTFQAALAFLDRRRALLAAALFGACLMLSAEAHLAKTDALLCACAVAAMGGLARAWLGRIRLARERGPPTLGVALAFWLALALGILVKGPMVPLFVGLAALALSLREGSARWLLALRPLPGLALTFLIVAPWFLAIAWKSGGAFYEASVGQDMLAKVGTGAERHWGPPGAYALVFAGTFWPGAPFALAAIPFAWRARRDDAVAFLLAWIVPAWLLLETVPTKLPHYVLPLMPAVAVLTVLALARGALAPTRYARLVTVLVVLVPAGLALLLAGAGWALDRTLPWAGLALLVGACALAWLAWSAFARGRAEGALALAVAASALLLPGVLGLAQADLPALKVSPRLAALRDHLPCPDRAKPRTASLGYREPSLVFLTETGLATPSTAAEAAAFLGAGGCRLVFVEAREAAAFAAAARAAGLSPARVGEVAGFNINGGRRVDLTAYAAGLSGDPAP